MRPLRIFLQGKSVRAAHEHFLALLSDELENLATGLIIQVIRCGLYGITNNNLEILFKNQTS